MDRKRQFLFLGLFFVSGACGLVYQVVWSRLLVFVFGGTTFATSTAVACFMGGLALGSFLAGRYGTRTANPARVYGILEIGIGLYCILVPLLLSLALPLYRALARATGGSFALLTVARLGIAALVLMAPTAMMGATLPLLCQAFVRDERKAGIGIALLYGFNTMGAFVGCVAGGFVLLPFLGLTRSTLLAAAMNVCAGMVAMAVTGTSGRTARASGATGSTLAPPVAGLSESGGRNAARPSSAFGTWLGPTGLLVLYALSGFAAMCYEVAWIRALILAIGGSTYAFSAIVACFILGIALGSLVMGRWVDRTRAPLAVAGWLEAAIGLGALVVVPLFGEMPRMVWRLAQTPDARFENLLAVEAACVMGLLAVPTICMGALMPLVCVAYSSMRKRDAGPDTGGSVGAVYAANTGGNIAGALAAGLVLIPLAAVGMQRTILIASALSGAVATAFLLGSGLKRRPLTYVALAVAWAVGIGLGALSAPWSKSVMISGPYLGRDKEPGKVLFYREGMDCTVAVTSTDGVNIALRVNGKPDASNSLGDMPTQYLSAHVPLMLRPEAKEVCVIGIGSGCTVGAVLAHPVERVDAVEISTGVIEAAKYFSACNYFALSDTRVHVHRADGRNFLLLTEQKYDLVISEPSNPWISGISNLYTKEFFEIVRSRLRPGGMHCQWIHAYSMKADDFASVLKTMASCFEHVQLWEMGLNDYVAICSDAPIVVDAGKMYKAFRTPAVARMLRFIMINDPGQLANHYIADGRDLAPWIGSQGLLTDDRQRLEFSAPFYVVGARSENVKIRERLNRLGGEPTMAGPSAGAFNGRFLKQVAMGRTARHHWVRSIIAGRTGKTQECLDGLVEVARNAPNDWRLLRSIDDVLERIRPMVGPDKSKIIDMYYIEIAGVAPGFLPLRETRLGRKATLPWPLGPAGGK